MSFRFPTRRLIALAAAYLVAAQAILLPLSVASANPLLSQLCISSPDGAGHAPAGSDGGCGCAAGCGMQCCAPGHMAAPPDEFRAQPVLVRVLAPVKRFGERIIADDRGAHRSRAPPAA